METRRNPPSDPANEMDTCRMCSTDWQPGGKIKRRPFLGGLVAGIYAVMSGVVLAPALGFIGAPMLRKKEKGSWIPVARMSDLADGETKSANYHVRVLDGYMEVERSYNIYLHREGSEIVAFDPTCPHLGCHVSFKEAKQRYMCPCHGGVFTKDGEVVAGPPPHGLAKLTTKVEDGRIWLYRV